MKPRSTLILAAIAAVVILAGWYAGMRPGRVAVRDETRAGQPAFPGIAPKLAAATRVELKRTGEAVVLDRRGDVWGVAEDSGYPAQPGKVHGVLAGLAELQLLEPRTADPAQYNRLGVEDPDKPKTDSTLVTVADADGGKIAALIVGHRRASRGPDMAEQVFVRRPGEAQSWLAEGRLPIDGDALMWLDRDIVNIDHTKVASVAVERGNEHIELVRDGDKLTMKQPAQHPELDTTKVADVARALEFLNFLRVEPAAKMPGSALGRSTFKTADGLALNVTVNQAGNEIWARFAAAGDGAAKPDAEQLQRKLGDWAYELGGWKEKALVPAMDDLKVPPPPAPPVATAPTTTSPPALPAAAPAAPPPAAKR
ncbi:MAG: DUF4340 domain-containing protein [Alphaproteobacteria bacterium]|nr:DUF4340 domain-containing protein [Alphaproteobacteria bacterium]